MAKIAAIGSLAIVVAIGLIVVGTSNQAQAQEAPREAAEQGKPVETPAGQPGAQPAEDPAAEDLAPEELSAEDVLREFQRERPTAEPLLPMDSEEPKDPGASTSGTAAIRMPDGFFLVDRTGRLVKDGSWWTIAFVGDNNPDTAPDPPLKLLPNQMLERAVREVQGGAVGVQFVVSGEVTEFMGENYLLLRKLMRKRDMGDLSR